MNVSLSRLKPSSSRELFTLRATVSLSLLMPTPLLLLVGDDVGSLFGFWVLGWPAQARWSELRATGVPRSYKTALPPRATVGPWA